MEPLLNPGCDAACLTREDDLLNRWPFANEVYRVAISGSLRNSVRIGVFGDWGSGKSSVLNFVKIMANEGGHIPVMFNPWEFSDTKTLWRAFIEKIDDAVKLRTESRSWRLTGKRFLERGTRVVEFFNPNFRGIDLLRRNLELTRPDLDHLLAGNIKRRLIVLIDDLDRTSARVVPDIFFALKDVMETSGIAFVCAFDPKVVGAALKEHHSGFDDGMRYLEKMIDYPMWLPMPTRDSLARLALKNAKDYCEFVPQDALKEAVTRLPDNPRQVRAFVRLLSQLRPQIERHNADELRWPVILAATSLKTRFPKLARPLLDDSGFWENVKQTHMSVLLRKEGETESVKDSISKHIDEVSVRNNEPISGLEKAEIQEALLAICQPFGWFNGIDSESLAYQVNIAESRNAVTWKEFNELFDVWRKNPQPRIVETWIASHSTKNIHSEEAIYRECLDAALRGYVQTISETEAHSIEPVPNRDYTQASILLGLLECLSSDLGQVGSNRALFRIEDFERMLKEFVTLANKKATPPQEALRKRESDILAKVVMNWPEDVSPLVSELRPFQKWHHSIHDNSVEGRSLHSAICDLAVPRFASWVLKQLRIGSFVKQFVWERGENFSSEAYMLTHVESPIWSAARQQTLRLFRENWDNKAIRENAFYLVFTTAYQLTREPNTERAKELLSLFADKEIAQTLWDCALSNPLEPWAVKRIVPLAKHCENSGITLTYPDWLKQDADLCRMIIPLNPD